MGIELPALSQSGQTKLVVWSFSGQSTVPPLHSSLVQCIDTPLGLGSYLQINFFKSVIKLPEKLKINLFFLERDDSLNGEASNIFH